MIKKKVITLFLIFRLYNFLSYSQNTDSLKNLFLEDIKKYDSSFNDTFNLAIGYLTDSRFERKNKLEGKITPICKFENLNDELIEFPTYYEKPVLLVFTSINCSPCQKAIPFLDSLSIEYFTKIEIISAYSTSKISDIENYIKSKKISHAVFKNVDNRILNKFDINIYPTFLIINKKK